MRARVAATSSAVVLSHLVFRPPPRTLSRQGIHAMRIHLMAVLLLLTLALTSCARQNPVSPSASNHPVTTFDTFVTAGASLPEPGLEASSLTPEDRARFERLAGGAPARE